MDDDSVTVNSIKSAITESAWSATYPLSESRTYCATGAPCDVQDQWDVCAAHIPTVVAQMKLNGPLDYTEQAGFPTPQKHSYVYPWAFSLAYFGDELSMQVPIIHLPELS
jgi:hypothetical protein